MSALDAPSHHHPSKGGRNASLWARLRSESCRRGLETKSKEGNKRQSQAHNEKALRKTWCHPRYMLYQKSCTRLLHLNISKHLRISSQPDKNTTKLTVKSCVKAAAYVQFFNFWVWLQVNRGFHSRAADMQCPES